MRPASAAAITKLSTIRGIEPINIVEIFWATGSRMYSDRQVNGAEGKILELSNLENIVDVTKSSNSQSISLTLDDVDGSIKNIYNTNDIHKRPVKVYQWFEGLSLSDKFLIFEGEISSPIVWREGDRTISFEIVSKIEDKEIGFSPEEGTFDELPSDLIGQAWPLPFGTCAKIPCIQLDPIPSGLITEGTGIRDGSIENEISRLSKVYKELTDLATLMFLGAIQAYSISTKPPATFNNPDSQWESLGDQYTEKGNEYLAQAQQALQDQFNLTAQLNAQKGYEKVTLEIVDGDTFPQNQNLSVNLGGANHTGFVSGNNFIIESREAPGSEEPEDVQTIPLVATTVLTSGTKDIPQKGNFFWVKGGSTFRVTSLMAVRYIVAMIPVTVLNIFAERNFGNTTKLIAVPNNYYTTYTKTFGSITATIVELHRPLSSYDQGWNDTVYADVTSSIGNNTADIMSWLIGTYTNLSIDSSTWNAVKTSLTPFPSNFCLFDRRNVLDVLRDIAYQARCAIWINNGVFYFRYLPEEPSPVDSIDSSDIITNSLAIEHTATESLTTKMTAEYQVDYRSTSKSKVILRNNVSKYGTQETNVDWFIYSTPDMVYLASTFWMIRQSNTWKLLSFKTPLHKLRLEAFDPVSITLPHSHNGTVTGIIESVQFNSEDFTLQFQVWIPVRLGEMDKYNFAWLGDASLVYPSGVDLLTAGSGGPGEDAEGTLVPINKASRLNIKTLNRAKPHYGHPNPGTTNVDTAVAITGYNFSVDNSDSPVFDYDYHDYQVEPFQPRLGQAGTLPGQVVSGSGSDYVVKVYHEGLSNTTRNVQAKCGGCNADLQPDDWVLVTTIVWQDDDDNTQLENVITQSKGNGSIPAKVLSGSGETYTVELYRQGKEQPATEQVTAKQLQIDLADTIPPGTWALVSEIGDKFYMQVAVFLE